MEEKTLLNMAEIKVSDATEPKDATLSCSPQEELPNEELGICPECGQPLQYVLTKHGRMVGCSSYPICKYIAPVTSGLGVCIEKIIEGRTCPQCGGVLAVKSGRYGMFIGCTCYPECQYTYREERPKIKCPVCGANVVQRKTRYNKVYWCCQHASCSFRASFKPVAVACEICGCATMLEKKNANGKYLVCCKCGHRSRL